jgi:DNA-directed RNA polymerase specialized sigma24 family protein
MTMAVVSEAVGTGAGHAQGFEEFFHAHYERLLRVLYISVGDRHEADDLAQDAFVRVHEGWPRGRRWGPVPNPGHGAERVAARSG